MEWLWWLPLKWLLLQFYHTFRYNKIIQFVDINFSIHITACVCIIVRQHPATKPNIDASTDNGLVNKSMCMYMYVYKWITLYTISMSVHVSMSLRVVLLQMTIVNKVSILEIIMLKALNMSSLAWYQARHFQIAICYWELYQWNVWNVIIFWENHL